MKQKIAIIIGAGPAGLTAAYELINKTDIKPIIFEMTSNIGGISATYNYKGNRIDIGGHRFFSKSDRIMRWWKKILPLQGFPARDDIILERKIKLSCDNNAPDPEKSDSVMLLRKRLSRIYFLRSFFDYPISFKLSTFKKLGLIRIIKILISYLKSLIFPIKKEKSLEDFFINRFGRELYLTFFKDYTEKVWGLSCNKIKKDWGMQRIKGLSIKSAIIHHIKSLLKKDTSTEQKNTETSLIECFMYPKYGPGQLWEEVANQIEAKGGEIHLNHKVINLKKHNNFIKEVLTKNLVTENIKVIEGDYFFSTEPVRELIQSIKPDVPEDVKKVANGLIYREFITVGLLLKELKIKNKTKFRSINNIIPDNWIYIQEKDVKLGRLQIFNNWSPYMVNDNNNVWIGLEYFCQEGDELWSQTDKDFAEFAIDELFKIGFIDKKDVLDYTVIKMPKAYPAYFGTYDKFQIIRDYIDNIENLFLIGRNGMHRYNNTDHSMLTAITAVENIINENKFKENICKVNTEDEYHEQK